MSIDPCPGPTLGPRRPEQPEVAHTFDLSRPDAVGSGYSYLHFAGDDNDHPGISEEARRLHGAGYYSAGFVNGTALDSCGRMATTVDKTQTHESRYYLAVNPCRTADRSTARKVLSEDTIGVESLPGVRLCHDQLWPHGVTLLTLCAERGPIVEISALARGHNSSPRGVHEIIRRMVNDSISRHETWFFAIVLSTLAALQANYGQRIFQTIGDDVALRAPDIAPGVVLRPVVVRPETVTATIREEADSVADSVLSARLRRSADFLELGDPAPSRPLASGEDNARSSQHRLTAKSGSS